MNGRRRGGFPAAGAISAIVILVVLGFGGCENSDVVPPAGTEIFLTANPATINAQGGTPQSTLSAQVTNSLGVSLPGQTVVFSTTEGTLIPEPFTPIETDDFGIAESDLVTFRTATVTARSGAATTTVTITVVQGDLNDIILNSDDITLNDCGETLHITARALDTQGVPINGLTITFRLRDKNGTSGSQGDYAGNFIPSTGVTQGSGEVSTDFLPDFPSCFDACSSSGSGDGSCSASVVAVDQTGNFESLPLVILDSVP